MMELWGLAGIVSPFEGEKRRETVKAAQFKLLTLNQGTAKTAASRIETA